ncbi:MAG: type II secretion system protein GspK, partial [Kiritimatiellae bacterium]|nr:type II secretion system protein GspK [Kiritimatiellia bacterium]
MSASRTGSALMLALITIVVLSTLMVSFLFRIQLESDLAARARFGMKAEHLARGGQEYAKWILLKSLRAGNEPEEDMEERFFVATKNLQQGVAISEYAIETQSGRILLSITPETSRRNINQLSDADWEQMLENIGLPNRHHARLIACFKDWTDADEATLLLGAEADDPHYQDLELPVKNGPVESLNELGMIKGFTRSILHGGNLDEFYDEPETQVTGILPLVSVYGDGSVNLNSAPRDVLMTVSGIREEQVDRLIEGRWGPDQIPGTEDDGYPNAAQAMSVAGLPADAQSTFSTSDLRWVRVSSIGESGPVRKGIHAIYEFSGNQLTLLSYQE